MKKTNAVKEELMVTKKTLVLLDEPYHGRDYLVIETKQEWRQIRKKIQLEANISTDALYPARFAVYYEKLGAYALAGHSSDLKMGSVQELGIDLVVAGENFGTGSSRVHAVMALRDAGIEMVIAKSFYPVWRKNAVNAGLRISTNLDLVEKFLGENEEATNKKEREIDARDLGLRPLERQILMSGGWLNYLKNFERKGESVTDFNEKNIGRKELEKRRNEKKAQTLIEKYLARAARVRASVCPEDEVMLDLREALLGSYDIYGGLIDKIIRAAGDKVAKKEQILATACHLHPGKKAVDRLKGRWRDFAWSHDCQWAEFGYGVCHTLLEQRAEPGQLVVFTDSHTPHIGWLGCGLSIGADDMAAAMVYQKTMYTVPASTKIVLRGKLRKGVMWRDVAMHILSLKLPAETCLEYHLADDVGSGEPPDWAVLTNIAVETQSVTAVIVPNQKLEKWLREKRPEVKRSELLYPDTKAVYVTEIEVELDKVVRMLAKPARPQNVMSLEKFCEKENGVKIDQVWIGSCVSGGWTEIKQALEIMRQKNIAKKVKVFIQPNSREVYIRILKKFGDWLLEVNPRVKLLPAACGACMGEGEGAVKKGETMISTATRNYVGRNAEGSQIYLASARTCAEVATTGMIASGLLEVR